MKSVYPASHLVRQFLLFALTVLFLQTVLRAAYGLWQFSKIQEANAILPLFLQGLRFDIALIGLICIVPLGIGSLLSITRFTKGLAKFVIILFLSVGLLLILILEFITPWFVNQFGMRPDIHLISSVDQPIEVFKTIASNHTVPFVIGVLISALIFFAFCYRLDTGRFLRYRVFAPTGILLALVGVLLCVMAFWSSPDIRQNSLSPGDSLISADVTVNDLAMNTTYKTIYSLIRPYLNKAVDTASGQ